MLPLPGTTSTACASARAHSLVRRSLFREKKPLWHWAIGRKMSRLGLIRPLARPFPIQIQVAPNFYRLLLIHLLLFLGKLFSGCVVLMPWRGPKEIHCSKVIFAFRCQFSHMPVHVKAREGNNLELPGHPIPNRVLHKPIGDFLAATAENIGQWRNLWIGVEEIESVLVTHVSRAPLQPRGLQWFWREQQSPAGVSETLVNYLENDCDSRASRSSIAGPAVLVRGPC